MSPKEERSKKAKKAKKAKKTAKKKASPPPKGTRIDGGATFFDYLMHLGRLAPKTVNDYAKIAARWHGPGQSPEAYLRGISGPDAKAGTVLPALSAARHWCEWMGRPLGVEKGSIRWQKDPGYGGVVMSRAEALALLKRCNKKAPGRLYALIILETGLRGNSLVRFDTALIESALRDGFYEVRAKGGRLARAPLTEKAKRLFRELALRGGAPGKESTLQRHWRECRKTYTGDKDLTKVTLHTFRHVYATELLMRGADLITVRDLMGQSKVSSTERYAHGINLGRAVDLLNNEPESEPK